MGRSTHAEFPSCIEIMSLWCFARKGYVTCFVRALYPCVLGHLSTIVIESMFFVSVKIVKPNNNYLIYICATVKWLRSGDNTNDWND